MKILVLSRSIFNALLAKNKITTENVEQQNKVFFISILNPDDKVPSYFESDKDNVKVMTFPDVDRDMSVPVLNPNAGPADIVETIYLEAFTQSQAAELYQFIKKHKDKEMCILHCTAGVSRSGAVGSFIVDFMGGNYQEFKRLNPLVVPNAHVYRMLHNEWYKDIAYNDAITGKPIADGSAFKSSLLTDEVGQFPNVTRLPFPGLLEELKNYHPEKRGNFEQFWLETDKFFEMVDESNLNVLEYCHPNFDDIMDCRKKVLPAGEMELFAEFGHGEAYSGIILSEWLKGKNMLSYFNR